MSNIEKHLRYLAIGEQILTGSVATKIISRLYNLVEMALPRPPGRGFVGDKIKMWVEEKIHGWMARKQDIYSNQEGICKDWMLPEIVFMSKNQLSDFEKTSGLFYWDAVNVADASGQVKRVNQKPGLKEISEDTENKDDEDKDEEEFSICPRRQVASACSQLSVLFTPI